MGEFTTAAAGVETDIASLEQRMAAAESRLTALEAGGPAPGPEPEPPTLAITPNMTTADIQRELMEMKSGETAQFTGEFNLTDTLHLDGLNDVTLRGPARLLGGGRVPFGLIAENCVGLRLLGGLAVGSYLDAAIIIGRRCRDARLEDGETFDCACGVRAGGQDWRTKREDGASEVKIHRWKSHDHKRMINIGDPSSERGGNGFIVGYTVGYIELIDCRGWNNLAKDPRISFGGHDGAEVEIFMAGKVLVKNYVAKDGEHLTETAGDTSGVVFDGVTLRNMGLAGFHQANGLQMRNIDHFGQGPNWTAFWVKRQADSVFGNGSTAGLSITNCKIGSPGGAIWHAESGIDPSAVINHNTYQSGALFARIGDKNLPTLADWQRATGKDANSTWSRA